MGKRGPKPKPKALKKLEGTHRPDREAPNAPEPEPGIPELPQGWGDDVPWGDEAVAEYRFIAPALERLGLLATIERAAILLYCDAWGRWIYYRRRVAESGDVQETPNGYLANSPATNLMNRAESDLGKRLAAFGLSPADRTRVSARTADGDDQDPAETLLFGPRIVKGA